MAKQKFYVVWDGAEDGVYTSWEACQAAVSGYSNAKYKAFKTEEEAEEAFEMGYNEWKKRQSPPPPEGGVLEDSNNGNSEDVELKSDSEQLNSDCTPITQNDQTTKHLNTQTNTDSAPSASTPPLGGQGALNNSIAVDAACSGNPGMMEYRGVYLRTGKEIFHYGPVYGTNNIGEFLAIVHGLALLKQKGLNDMPIYSDSRNAQLWVKKKQCKTTLERNERTEQLFQMIERAEAWLHNNTWQNQIIKWPTDQWGEIPADFGRK